MDEGSWRAACAMDPGDDDTDETGEFEDRPPSDSDRGCCSWSSDSVDVEFLASVNLSAGAGSF